MKGRRFDTRRRRGDGNLLGGRGPSVNYGLREFNEWCGFDPFSPLPDDFEVGETTSPIAEDEDESWPPWDFDAWWGWEDFEEGEVERLRHEILNSEHIYSDEEIALLELASTQPRIDDEEWDRDRVAALLENTNGRWVSQRPHRSGEDLEVDLEEHDPPATLQECWSQWLIPGSKAVEP